MSKFKLKFIEMQHIDCALANLSQLDILDWEILGSLLNGIQFNYYVFTYYFKFKLATAYCCTVTIISESSLPGRCRPHSSFCHWQGRRVRVRLALASTAMTRNLDLKPRRAEPETATHARIYSSQPDSVPLAVGDSLVGFARRRPVPRRQLDGVSLTLTF